MSSCLCFSRGDGNKNKRIEIIRSVKYNNNLLLNMLFYNIILVIFSF